MSILLCLLYGTPASFVANATTPIVTMSSSPAELESPLAAAYRPLASSTASPSLALHALAEDPASCDTNLIPPIGVMGAHAHSAGEWMLGYRYMTTRYQGMRDGTHHMSSGDVLAQGFAQSPTSMTMQMHEIEAMYGVTDELSLMMSLPYVLQSMPQVDGAGDSFTTHASGVGDVALSALYAFRVRETDRCIASFGVSVPTGSIDQRDDMPGCPDCRLEYMMQNGSGTVDLLPALAYVSSNDDWSFGAQAQGRVRLGTNDNGYRLGDRGELTAWTGYRWAKSWRSSLRVNGAVWGNVTGADPELDPMMSPTNDAGRQGGRRIDVALGLDWFASSMGTGLGIELGLPVYQDLDGPQPDAQWFATAGLRFMF